MLLMDFHESPRISFLRFNVCRVQQIGKVYKTEESWLEWRSLDLTDFLYFVFSLLRWYLFSPLNVFFARSACCCLRNSHERESVEMPKSSHRENTECFKVLQLEGVRRSKLNDFWYFSHFFLLSIWDFRFGDLCCSWNLASPLFSLYTK